MRVAGSQARLLRAGWGCRGYLSSVHPELPRTLRYSSDVAWRQIVLPGVASAVLTMLITPYVIQLATRLRAFDVPGGRKRHQRSTPRLGGLAIVGAIVLVLGPALLLLSPGAFQGLRLEELLGFAVAAGLVFCLGLADDLVGLGALPKFAVQIIAALIVVGMGWQFDTVRLPVEGAFHLGVLAPALSVLWIVGVTNAINLIDGLDGLAAGIVAIISSSLLVLSLLQGSPETVIGTSCIVGACLGFLRHNWSPARIYMGDSGSLVLGFLLATISLRSSPSVKASATLAILVPLLALGLPVIDTVLVMWFRFLRGHRRMNRIARMFHADRAHIHHLLLDNAAERSSVMLILFGMAITFCVMALLVAASDSWWMGVGFLFVEFVAVVLVRRIGLTAEARRVAGRKIDTLSSVPNPMVEPLRKGRVETTNDSPAPRRAERPTRAQLVPDRPP